MLLGEKIASKLGKNAVKRVTKDESIINMLLIFGRKNGPLKLSKIGVLSASQARS
jgi:hypothetical protein